MTNLEAGGKIAIQYIWPREKGCLPLLLSASSSGLAMTSPSAAQASCPAGAQAKSKGSAST
jgi:hypothetical protein